MEHKEFPEVEITLKELLAAVLHGGRLVVILGLVFALALGAYGAYSAPGVDAGQEAYQLQLEEYEKTREQLETALARSEKELESELSYLESSCLMQIDPYHKYTSTLVFAISNVDPGDSKDSYSVLENPASYMISRIQAQYKVLWDGLDLENAVDGTAYAGVADKYLREIAKLEASDGGVLKLTVMGSSEETEKLATNIYQLLLEKKTLVEQASYSHAFTLLTDAVTQTTVDLELEQKQQEIENKLVKTRDEVKADEAALAALRAPAVPGNDNSGIVKNVVIGGALGVILAGMWLVGVQLVNSKVACADRMARHFGLVHFGSVRGCRCIFPVLAQRLMNAQVWKDEAQALDFIREKGSVHLPENGSVILVSTLPKVDEKLVNKLMDAMSAEGRTVSFAADMLHDPKALSGIRNADALVLVERAYATENAAVVSAMYLAEEMNKPVCGFVMV